MWDCTGDCGEGEQHMPHTSCLRAELFLRNRGFLYKRALNESEAEPVFAAGIRDGT